MYLNWQNQGYFLSCCLPHTDYCAVILQPICSTISHFPVLPGRRQQIPVCAWRPSREWGRNLYPTARASFPSLRVLWTPYSLVFPPAPHPKTAFQASNHGQVLASPRFSNENSARTLLCSITERIKHPLNCWTLKHHPQPLPVKNQDQILNPNLSQDSKKSPYRVQLRSADSTAQFQEPDSFNSGSKHLYRAMEIRARCQWLPLSQKGHSDHQR